MASARGVPEVHRPACSPQAARAWLVYSARRVRRRLAPACAGASVCSATIATACGPGYWLPLPRRGFPSPSSSKLGSPLIRGCAALLVQGPSGLGSAAALPEGAFSAAPSISFRLRAAQRLDRGREWRPRFLQKEDVT